MAKYTNSVKNDIRRRSKTFGIALRIACLPFALIAGGTEWLLSVGQSFGLIPVAVAGCLHVIT